MKGNSESPKAPGLDPYYQMLFSVINRTLVYGKGFISAEMKEYPTALADLAHL